MGEIINSFDNFNDDDEVRDINTLKEKLNRLQAENYTLQEELTERNKELETVYKISSLLEESNRSLSETLQKAVEIIPGGWQYPEITCARICISNSEYKTDNFQETIWRQNEPLKVHGRPEFVRNGI